MLRKNINITNCIDEEELISLEEGGIVASEENLMTAVMYQISHCDNLLRLLYYNEEDPLSKKYKNIVNEDGSYVDELLFKEEILDKLLFFSKRLPTDKSDRIKSTYLTIDFGSRKTRYDMGTIYVEFYIMVHQDLLILNNYRRRMAMIKMELMKLFDGAEGQFLGMLEYTNGNTVTVPSVYRCYKMVFEATDINRR